MRYTKQVGGPWVKAADLKNGTKAVIVSETREVTSRFPNEDGSPKMQNVATVRFEGHEEAMNANLNRATIYGLIDAFGEESKDWINKPLTVQTEKVVVGGKRVTAMYLVPQGFEVGEENGYVVIRKVGSSNERGAALDEAFPESDIQL